jgi:hypothetical protein
MRTARSLSALMMHGYAMCMKADPMPQICEAAARPKESTRTGLARSRGLQIDITTAHLLLILT